MLTRKGMMKEKLLKMATEPSTMTEELQAVLVWQFSAVDYVSPEHFWE